MYARSGICTPPSVSLMCLVLNARDSGVSFPNANAKSHGNQVC